MKLSIPLLYEPLSHSFSFRRISRNSAKIQVDRPVFYFPGAEMSGHVILIRSEEYRDLPRDSPLLRTCFFLCFGKEEASFYLKNTDLLLFSLSQNREEVLNGVQEIFQRFERWDSSMQECLREGRNFSDLITCCESVFPTSFALVDDRFRFIACGNIPEDEAFRMKFINENRTLPIPIASMLISDPSYPETLRLTGVYRHTLEQITALFKNIFYQNNLVGKLAVVTTETKAGDDCLREMLNLAAVYIKRAYERYGSFEPHSPSAGTLHELIPRQLDGESIQPPELSLALSSLGWSEGDTCQLIQLRPDYRYDKILYARYFCPEIERKWEGTCCLEYRQALLILLDIDVLSHQSQGDFFQDLAYFLRENLLSAAVSRGFTDFSRLDVPFRQTNLAFQIGSLRDPTLWCYHFDDYALEYLLLQGPGDFLPDEIGSPSLSILLQHDRKTGTEYYKTLRIYLDCGFNAAHASKRLYIHRSTFLNRLSRILELTQLKLDSSQIRLYLAMSYALRDLEEHREAKTPNEGLLPPPAPSAGKKNSDTTIPPDPKAPTPKSL